MSRIHEALKRAEKERAAGNAGHNAELLVENRATPQPPKHAAVDSPASPTALRVKVEPATPGEPLQFEDLSRHCAKHKWKPDTSLLVFNSSNPFSSGTEQFRTLRSRLYRIRESQPLQTILISSAIPAEGKTVVSANLALAVARQQGCRVLLIDADLRAPRVHSLLGAPPSPGLADYLQGDANEFDIIQRGDEEGLCFIPGGNHAAHPSELISSNSMKLLLERVRPAFDWILIDSSPVLPVADASVLGGLCDGVLVVVRANSTPAETARKACREFKDAHILGVVLNTVEPTSEYGAYYSERPYGRSDETASKK